MNYRFSHSHKKLALRRIRFLSSYYVKAVQSQSSTQKIKELKAAIIRLVKQLSQLATRKVIRKALAPSLLLSGMLGSPNLSAQIFSPPKEIDQVPTSAILIPTLIDLDSDGDLDIFGYGYDEVEI